MAGPMEEVRGELHHHEGLNELDEQQAYQAHQTISKPKDTSEPSEGNHNVEEDCEALWLTQNMEVENTRNSTMSSIIVTQNSIISPIIEHYTSIFMGESEFKDDVTSLAYYMYEPEEAPVAFQSLKLSRKHL